MSTSKPRISEAEKTRRSPRYVPPSALPAALKRVGSLETLWQRAAGEGKDAAKARRDIITQALNEAAFYIAAADRYHIQELAREAGATFTKGGHEEPFASIIYADAP